MILAKDKSIGLTIEDNVVSSKGKRKTIDGVHICFYKKSWPLFSDINFKNAEFFRFCAFLEKTKSDTALQELRKMWSQIEKNFDFDGIDFYGGISYSGDKANLGYGTATKKIIGASEAAKVKCTYIHRSFGVVSVGSDKYEVNKTKKTIRKMVSNTPGVSISLERNAFMKFRLACLRAIVKLKNRN